MVNVSALYCREKEQPQRMAGLWAEIHVRSSGAKHSAASFSVRFTGAVFSLIGSVELVQNILKHDLIQMKGKR
jgi:hypothetical protein